MTTEERIFDIVEANEGIEKNELKKEDNGIFQSIEFYQINHYTNEELYYLDDETKENFQNSSDLIFDTKKGKVFCFK